jgi:hypothetical protein
LEISSDISKEKFGNFLCYLKRKIWKFPLISQKKNLEISSDISKEKFGNFL